MTKALSFLAVSLLLSGKIFAAGPFGAPSEKQICIDHLEEANRLMKLAPGICHFGRPGLYGPPVAQLNAPPGCVPGAPNSLCYSCSSGDQEVECNLPVSSPHSKVLLIPNFSCRFKLKGIGPVNTCGVVDEVCRQDYYKKELQKCAAL